METEFSVTSMKRRIVIGTRGSELALWQASAVASAIEDSFPGIETELKVISTSGDRIQDRPLAALGDKGLFTKELEGALLSGEVDLCVHSLKDLPTQLPEGLKLAATLKREDPRDVLVYGQDRAETAVLDELPAGTVIGSGSTRRRAQLRAYYPQLEVVNIRGNVDTRIKKALGDGYDGAILAAAGLKRLGRSDVISSFIDIEKMTPAPGQGALGIEIRENDQEIEKVCDAINDQECWDAVSAERWIMDSLEGGCSTPIGVYARLDSEKDRWIIDAVVLTPDGQRQCRSQRLSDGDDKDALHKIAQDVLDDLVNQGVIDLLASLDRENQ